MARLLLLADAFEVAERAGVRVRVIARLKPQSCAVRIGVSTTDPAPLVTFAVDGARDSGLFMREQSGPERWDYHAVIESSTDEYLLRLRDSVQVDVPILSATAAIFSTHGWTEDMSLAAEAVVNERILRAAVREAAGTRAESLGEASR